jgi:hypothetical protein
MLRIIAWAALALYLLIVGLIPAAAAPVPVIAAGAGVIAAAIPGPAWLAAAGIAWLRHKPAPAHA